MNNYLFEILTICRTVEDYFNLPRGSLQLNTRKREIAQARQLAMYFARKLTRLTTEKIGIAIGGKDHATVLNAIKVVQNLRSADIEYRKYFDDLEKKLDYPIISKSEINDAINQALIKHFAKVIEWKNIYKSML